ncbi:NUDIX domain-containing protein [Patescibacteria group bacterium]|nr:NUDIX domain-containing protein [Patescibacteria group bacterium]
MKKKRGSETPKVVIGVMICDDKERILLIRSHKWGNKYIVCGGKLEWGEELEECVKREVKEEVGLKIEKIELIFVFESVFSLEFYKREHMIFLNYCCRKIGGKVNLNNEADGFVWVALEKALGMDLNFSTKEFVRRYIKFKARG